MERIYVALDVETTGLDPASDEIIEVAAVKFRGDEVLETYQQLVKPHHALPLKITRLTGITDADVEDAPRFVQIGPDLVRFLKSYPLVGHSVSFDIRMLEAAGMRLPQQSFDTFDLATLLMPHAPAYRLGALAAALGIVHEEAHRALSDADVARQIFLQMLKRIDALSLDELGEINRLTSKIQWPLRDLFSEAEKQKAKNFFVEGAGISPVGAEPTSPALQRRGNAVAAAEVLEYAPPPTQPPEFTPLKPTDNTEPLDLARVRRFFAPEGAMGRAFAGYEQRDQQVAMAEAVGNAFNTATPLMVEAGTGTGKSMSYLVPAAMWAAQRGERVVVSTNTINLQDQLFFKDIPDLQRLMIADADASPDSISRFLRDKTPFKAALLKGRGNYLCLKRYHELRRDGRATEDEIRALLKVQLWLPTTISGDRAELMFMDRENTSWGKINVTADTCVGPRCPFFKECFFFQARREAEAAHVVVVNHALMLADLSTEANVLPPYDHLIIDEAHNLEDVATDQLGFAVDQSGLLDFLDSMFSEGGAALAGGMFAELPQRFQESAAGQSDKDKALEIVRTLGPVVTRARASVYDCFNRLMVFMNQEAEVSQYDPRLRLTDKERKHPGWAEVELTWGNLALQLQEISTALGRLEALLTELEDAGIDDQEVLLLRVQGLKRFVTEVRINVGAIIVGGEEQLITWLVYDRNREMLKLHAAPLSVAELLRGNLFEQKATTVLASATISVNNDFGFIRARIGLEQGDDLQLDSPFDYNKQALVYLPSDMPEPNHPGYQRALEAAIIELCAATNGRALVLFTANSALRQTYRAIQEPLEARGITVLAQGLDGSRRSLIQRFKEFPQSVLLGTTSFWEGVDVVGDALSVLIIAKLPFAVPNDPVYAARSELCGDPFNELSVPQAILRFKQGFGRLIRSKDDRGVVAVLDKRLISKRYGQVFLDSLPETAVRSGLIKHLPGLAARFLAVRAAEV
ncbi:MAG: 3'-5' exoribonuclease [Roseiflexaceae bacterium]|nr:3'-5' exoribonuclease [Roseiflexaceae bacterium]